MSIGTKQHYVPQFLIRPFGLGNSKSKRTVFAFDKRTSEVSSLFVKDAAAIHGYYDLSSGADSLDPLIGEVESKSAPILRQVADGLHPTALTHAERRTVSLFLALQLLRTPAMREDQRRQMEVISQILSKRGASEEWISQFKAEQSFEDDSVKLIASVAPQMVPSLLNKTWLTFRTTSSAPLYTSDNPVNRHNPLPAPPYRSNQGLENRGITINVPLNPQIMLSIACREMMAELALRDLRIATAITMRRPVPLLPINVEFHNSLQVIYSERFVFSSSADFSLAKDMVAKDASLRDGPRSLIIHPDGDSYPQADIERWNSGQKR